MNVFEEVHLNNLTLKNRLVRSATWESLASPEGFLNDEIYAIYEELAKGGVGLIVTGLTDVAPYNWSLVGNMRLCSDVLIPDYERLTKIVHRYNCKIIPEINLDQYMCPRKRIETVKIDDMTEPDIQAVVRLFADAAGRAKKANFDGVQLHLAYGWFLNRFINPLCNHRTDAYGGSTENRCRILGDIISAIRSKVHDFHISAKFSFFDDAAGGLATDECVAVCREIEKYGLDSLEILGGHSPTEKGTKHEACYLDLAVAVKHAVSIPVILTGNNHDIYNMEKLLNEQGIEMFALSRPLIREPDLPMKWQNGSSSLAKCVSCSMCYTTHGKRCIFHTK